MSKLQQENEELKRRLDEQQEELESFKSMLNKQQHLMGQVKDKLECPVHMEIPQSGPVPVCPNGHLVCKDCKRDSCPTCRAPMGGGRSLLAATIIQNIEQKCRFNECEEKFYLRNIAQHAVLVLGALRKFHLLN